MATTDKSHLERHGNQWRVTISVPKAARANLGKAHLKESLNTPNLATANLLKPPVIARLKAVIEAAMRDAQPADIYEEARTIRAIRKAAPKRYATTLITAPRTGQDTEVEVEEDDDGFYAVERAEQIAEKLGDDAALAFAEVAFGRATPLNEHLTEFVADHPYEPKSLLELERAVRRLGEWLSDNGRKQTIEAVDQEAATGFMRHLVHSQALSAKSAGKYVSFLRTYWGWLAQHRHLSSSASPWLAKPLKPKAPSRHADLQPDEGKRPYTTEELRTLLTGPGGPLIDLIRLAALTGMRIEELYGLRARDVQGGFFFIRTGKTSNAARKVPVHEELGALVERLTLEKAPNAYLVDPSAEVVTKTGLRSGAASKAFGRYRRGLGLDERPNGKAKSNIDFHSLRRWFIKSARDALLNGHKAYNLWTIADVVGHDNEGVTDTLRMTMGVYPGVNVDEALRACVAAVKLPE